MFFSIKFEFPDTHFFFHSDEEILNEEELDKELLWNLQLLSEVIESCF